MLQMNLRFARAEPVRSVLVTSARTGEGKTTVAWNLAAAAASGGLSVALVEADLRRPSLAERYDLETAPGLAEALQGEVSISAALQTILPIPGSANPVGHPRPLHVIVAGSPAPNPWALMQSSVMARVLEVLRKDHDLVVIDTPPMPHVVRRDLAAAPRRRRAGHGLRQLHAAARRPAACATSSRASTQTSWASSPTAGRR